MLLFVVDIAADLRLSTRVSVSARHSLFFLSPDL